MRLRPTINLKSTRSGFGGYEAWWLDTDKGEIRQVEMPSTPMTLRLDTLPPDALEEIEAAVDERENELVAFREMLYEIMDLQGVDEPLLHDKKQGAHKGWDA